MSEHTKECVNHTLMHAAAGSCEGYCICGKDAADQAILAKQCETQKTYMVGLYVLRTLATSALILSIVFAVIRFRQGGRVASGVVHVLFAFFWLKASVDVWRRS